MLPHIFWCRFRPLAVCVPQVVKEFHQQSMRHGLMDWTSLQPELELLGIFADPAAQAAAEAAAAAASTLAERNQRKARPLEMFFPFDPYLLPKCAFQHCRPPAMCAEFSANFDSVVLSK